MASGSYLSVLFKALNKAAVDNRSRETAEIGVPLIGGAEVTRARRPVRPGFIVGAGALAVVLAGGFLFADDLIPMGQELAAGFSGSEPVRPQPLPPAPTPQLAAVTVPSQPAPASVPTPAPAPAPAPAPVATPSPATPQPAVASAEPVAPTVVSDPDPDGKPIPLTPRGRTVGAAAVPSSRRLPAETEMPGARAPLRIDRAVVPSSIDRDPEQDLRVANRGDSPRTASVTRLHETAYRSLSDGNYELALKQYQEVLQRERDNRPAMLGKAVSLQKLGLNNAAQEAYEELLAIDPSNRAATTNLLSLISLARPEQALLQLQRLEAANPTSLPIITQVGMIHAQMGDLPRAIRQMQLAVSLAPESPVYKLNLAILYDRAGRRREALPLYQDVLVRSTDATQALPMALDDVRRRVAYLAAGE